LEHFQNEKTNRSGYLRGLALDCYLNPENDRNSHYLGRELLWSGRPKSAIKELQRHIDMNKWPTEKAQSMIFIGDACKSLGSEESAIEWYHNSFTIESGRREALMRLAQLYYEKRDAQKTLCYCAMALEILESNFYANDLSDYTNKPHELMYWALWQLGRTEESKKHFDLAFNYQIHNSKYLFDYRWYYELPKVSIIIPNLGRPDGLKRCLDSIEILNYPRELIETIVIEDEPRLGVPARVKEGIEKSTGEWIVYAANDMEFTSNSLIEILQEYKKTKKRLISFNAGQVLPDGGNKCEHFAIKRDLISLLERGEVFSLDFYHVGCDNWLCAQAEKINEFMWCEHAKINHYHFSKTGIVDDVNKLAWKEEMVIRDRDILKNKLASL